jgi:hypothetical protein
MSTAAYLRTKFPDANTPMTFHIWKERFAFSFKDYPKLPNGDYDLNYKISQVVRDEHMEPYWHSIHEVAMINLKTFIDYIDGTGSGATGAKRGTAPSTYTLFYPSKQIAPYVAFDRVNKVLCFNPLDF